MSELQAKETNMFKDAPWPGNVLSNFAETPFVFDGVTCRCSEAFIQSLKITDPVKQKDFCSLSGQEAWERGSKETENVFSNKAIWWLGKKYPLHSNEHFALVKRALIEKYSQSDIAKEALLASIGTELVHEFGKPKGEKQSLPIEQFCRIVAEIRDELEKLGLSS
jgi:predicted NAD-dependent protein-ADP-ribosyltransferase YbiA (DUF1768 family)